jgi:hypothetical protein
LLFTQVKVYVVVMEGVVLTFPLGTGTSGDVLN